MRLAVGLISPIVRLMGGPPGMFPAMFRYLKPPVTNVFVIIQFRRQQLMGHARLGRHADPCIGLKVLLLVGVAAFSRLSWSRNYYSSTLWLGAGFYCAVKNVRSTLPFSPIRQTKRWA